MPTLGDEKRRDYREQGFVRVPGLFGPDELALWNGRFEDIAEGRVEAAPELLVMRDVMVAKGAVKPARRLEEIAKIQDKVGILATCIACGVDFIRSHGLGSWNRRGGAGVFPYPTRETGERENALGRPPPANLFQEEENPWGYSFPSLWVHPTGVCLGRM